MPSKDTDTKATLLEEDGGATGNQYWTSGICECLDGPDSCSLCMWAWCCNCCLVGQNYAMLNNEIAIVNPEPWAMVCTAPCWLHFLLSGNYLWCILPMYIRSQIRLKYNIVGPGTKLLDCWGETVDDCLCRPSVTFAL